MACSRINRHRVVMEDCMISSLLLSFPLSVSRSHKNHQEFCLKYGYDEKILNLQKWKILTYSSSTKDVNIYRIKLLIWKGMALWNKPNIPFHINPTSFNPTRVLKYLMPLSCFVKKVSKIEFCSTATFQGRLM